MCMSAVVVVVVAGKYGAKLAYDLMPPAAFRRPGILLLTLPMMKPRLKGRRTKRNESTTTTTPLNFTNPLLPLPLPPLVIHPTFPSLPQWQTDYLRMQSNSILLPSYFHASILFFFRDDVFSMLFDNSNTNNTIKEFCLSLSLSLSCIHTDSSPHWNRKPSPPPPPNRPHSHAPTLSLSLYTHTHTQLQSTTKRSPKPIKTPPNTNHLITPHRPKIHSNFLTHIPPTSTHNYTQ